MLVNPGTLLQVSPGKRGGILANAATALAGFTPYHYWDFINDEAILAGVPLTGVMNTPGITGKPRMSSQGLYVDAAADVLLIPLAPPANPFTVYVEFNRIVDTGAAQRILHWDDDTSNNQYLTGTNTADLNNATVTTGGVAQAGITAVSTWTLNTVKKSATRFATNDVALCFSAATPVTDAAATMPSGITILRIGSARAGASLANGYIRRIAVFNSGLTNANLQTLTT